MNLGVLTLLLAVGISPPLAYLPAIGVSIVSNFVLNRILTFRYALGRSIGGQFVGFLCASMIGASAQYLTACSIVNHIPSFIYRDFHPQLAALAGILVGFVFNFLINRHFVFRVERRATDSAGEIL